MYQSIDAAYTSHQPDRCPVSHDEKEWKKKTVQVLTSCFEEITACRADVEGPSGSDAFRESAPQNAGEATRTDDFTLIKKKVPTERTGGERRLNALWGLLYRGVIGYR